MVDYYYNISKLQARCIAVLFCRFDFSSPQKAVANRSGGFAVDIEVAAAAARTRIAASAWSGAPRYVLTDLSSDTEYTVRVRRVRGQARGDAASETFRTLTLERERELCAMALPTSVGGGKVCDALLRPNATECAEVAAGGWPEAATAT